MADDWKSWSFRQKVIMQMEEIIRQSPAASQRNAQEIELQVHVLNTSVYIFFHQYDFSLLLNILLCHETQR